MSARRKRYQPKPFESMGQSWDTSANIYHSMQMSAAWKDLSPQQKTLYLACKDQFYAERKKPEENDPASFTMARHRWMNEYELYSEGNQQGFYRDMKALIEHGFVELVYSGKITRTRSVYRLSSNWRRWTAPSAPAPPEAQDQEKREVKKKPASGEI